MMIRYVDGSLRDENGDLFLRSARECYDGVMIAPCARRASNASHVTDPSGDAGGCECGRKPMCVRPMAVLGIPRRVLVRLRHEARSQELERGEPMA